MAPFRITCCCDHGFYDADSYLSHRQLCKEFAIPFVCMCGFGCGTSSAFTQHLRRFQTSTHWQVSTAAGIELKVMTYNILTPTQGDAPPPWLYVVDPTEARKTQQFLQQHESKIRTRCIDMGFEHLVPDWNAQALFQQLVGKTNGAITQLYVQYWHNCPGRYLEESEEAEGATLEKWRQYRSTGWWRTDDTQADKWTGKPNLYGGLQTIFEGQPELAESLFLYLKKSVGDMHWRNRGPMLFNRIMEIHPDILVLTEYQKTARDHKDFDLAFALAQADYRGISFEEDVAVFWHTAKAHKVDAEQINERVSKEGALQPMLPRPPTGNKEVVSVEKLEVAQNAGLPEHSLGIVRLTLANGRCLVVLGTHFRTRAKDHLYEMKGAEVTRVLDVTRKLVEKFEGAAIILAGDLNMNFHETAAALHLKTLVETTFNGHTFANVFPEPTQSSMTTCTPSRTELIDYIFCFGAGVHEYKDCERTALKSRHALEREVGYMPNSSEPSDHVPLFATLRIASAHGT